MDNDIENFTLNETIDDPIILSSYGFKINSTTNLKKPQSISLKLIIDRNLTDKDSNKELEANENQSIILESIDTECIDQLDVKAKKILKLTRIHLDRENITEIDNLVEYLGSNVTHICLQHNLIKKIENLEFFHNLKFLFLSNNQIKTVENLNSLVNLRFLDLSFNQIDTIDDVKEFPLSLLFLDLRNNEQLDKEWKNYSNKIQSFLINLRILNGEELFEEDEETEETPKEKKISNQVDITNEIDSLRLRILDRSLQRQKNDITNLDKISQQHKLNLDEIRRSIDLQISSIKSRKN